MVRSDTLAQAGHCTSGHQELRAANTHHSSSASVPRDPPAPHCHDTSPVTCHELSRGLPCHDDPLRPAGDRLHHPDPAAHGALTPRLPPQVDIYRPRYPVDIIYTYLHISPHQLRPPHGVPLHLLRAPAAAAEAVSCRGRGRLPSPRSPRPPWRPLPAPHGQAGAGGHHRG